MAKTKRKTTVKVVQVQAKANPRKKSGNRRRQGPKRDRNKSNLLQTGLNSYRKLILDPCNAPLVHPPVDGRDSGYLIRTRTMLTFPTVSAANGFYGVYYHPAANQVFQFEVPTNVTFLTNTISSTASTTNPANIYTQSSDGFLAGVADSYRPVAACVTFTYSGAEQNRSGTISWSNRVSFEQFLDGVSLGMTFPMMDTACSNSARVPVGDLTMKWIPDWSAQRFYDQSSIATGTSAQVLAAYPDHPQFQNGMLFIVQGGSQNSNQNRVEITTVYEWKPRLVLNGGGVLAGGSEPPYPMGASIDRALSGLKDAFFGGLNMMAESPHAGLIVDQMLNMATSTRQLKAAGRSF